MRHDLPHAAHSGSIAGAHASLDEMVAIEVRLPADPSVVEEVLAGIYGTLQDGCFIAAPEFEALDFRRIFDGSVTAAIDRQARDHHGSGPAMRTRTVTIEVPADIVRAFKATLAELCLERWSLRYQTIQAAFSRVTQGDGAYFDKVEMECFEVTSALEGITLEFDEFTLPGMGPGRDERVIVRALSEEEARRVLALVPAGLVALAKELPTVQALTQDGSGPAGVMPAYGELMGVPAGWPVPCNRPANPSESGRIGLSFQPSRRG